MSTLHEVGTHSQIPRSRRTASPLALVIGDLRTQRNELLPICHLRHVGRVAGQLVLLLREYERGKRPSRRTLRIFLGLMGRELDAWQREAA
jgi:hypothetical protein